MASVTPFRKGKTYANTERMLYRLVRQEVRETRQVRRPLPPLRRKVTGSKRGSDVGPGGPRLGRGCATSCRCAMWYTRLAPCRISPRNILDTASPPHTWCFRAQHLYCLALRIPRNHAKGDRNAVGL